MLAIVGAFLSLLGSAFFVLAAIGLLRMPDALNRMQAGTKATTLGSILFLLGIGLMRPDFLGRIIILILFIVLTNPVSSNALARAAHAWRGRIGLKMTPDALAEAEADQAALATSVTPTADTTSAAAANSTTVAGVNVAEVPHDA